MANRQMHIKQNDAQFRITIWKQRDDGNVAGAFDKAALAVGRVKPMKPSNYKEMTPRRPMVALGSPE